MNGLLGTGVLALWLDLTPEVEAETDVWYIEEHLPERIDVGGYLRARRYECIDGGSPKYLSLFEAQTPEALASSGYLSLVSSISERSRRIRSGFRNVSRNTFEVKASFGRGTGGVMASIRLRATEGVGPAPEWVSTHIQQLLKNRLLTGAHWLVAAPNVREKMDAQRAVGQQDKAVDQVIMIESTRQQDLDAALQEHFFIDTLSSLGLEVEDMSNYRLLYQVA